jgi:hypothetical protein
MNFSEFTTEKLYQKKILFEKLRELNKKNKKWKSGIKNTL